jgi:hypothetical protein
LWFSFSFESSIICFIISASLGVVELDELLEAAGLEVVVVEVALEVAGLEVVAGGLGAAVGLWAAAMEAVAVRMASVLIKCVGLMCGDFVKGKWGPSSSA